LDESVQNENIDRKDHHPDPYLSEMLLLAERDIPFHGGIWLVNYDIM
jgi:hypothetical protein